jgi:DNA replication protein DnaC
MDVMQLYVFGYAQFCHRYRVWLGCQQRSMRQIHRAGEKLFVDYCGPTMTIVKLIAQLAKTDLLILDDWGLEKMTLSQHNDLLEIMEDRHGLKSTLITSQLPIIQWYKAIGDATLADAILDRLLHNSHKLKLKGESMRKVMSELTESDHSQ